MKRKERSRDFRLTKQIFLRLRPFWCVFLFLFVPRSLSRSHEGINHQETIADDLNERNSLLDVHSHSRLPWVGMKQKRRARTRQRNGKQIRNNTNEVIFRQVLDNQRERTKEREKNPSIINLPPDWSSFLMFLSVERETNSIYYP